MQVPKAIRTERLLLRRSQIEDLEAFSSFLTDPAAVHYMAFTEEQKTPKGAEQMLQWVIDAYDSKEPIFSLTIADPTTNRYLGSCGLHPDSGGGLEIYYTVIPSEQRRGIATEAAKAIVLHAIVELGATRLVAYVVPENKASVRVAQKLGFVDDGPAVRDAAEAGMVHAKMKGHRYILRS